MKTTMREGPSASAVSVEGEKEPMVRPMADAASVCSDRPRRNLPKRAPPSCVRCVCVWGGVG
jgi:hypothetical protein